MGKAGTQGKAGTKGQAGTKGKGAVPVRKAGMKGAVPVRKAGTKGAVPVGKAGTKGGCGDSIWRGGWRMGVGEEGRKGRGRGGLRPTHRKCATQRAGLAPASWAVIRTGFGPFGPGTLNEEQRPRARARARKHVRARPRPRAC